MKTKSIPSAKKRLSRAGRSEVAVDLAFAACRSIQFAVANASRHGGDFNLNDILAAHKLATEALKNR